MAGEKNERGKKRGKKGKKGKGEEKKGKKRERGKKKGGKSVLWGWGKNDFLEGGEMIENRNIYPCKFLLENFCNKKN